MIQTLEITNFKSIKKLKLDCRRFNIFIGEPNTGKSNILEAIGVFSYPSCVFYGADLSKFVRFERPANLFYDQNLEEAVEIKLDSSVLTVKFENGRFEAQFVKDGSEVVKVAGGHRDFQSPGRWDPEPLRQFKFYRFAVLSAFPKPESEFLLPPSGENLMSLLLTHRQLRAAANRLFSPFGLRLNLRPHENQIEVIKQLEDITISYPYSLASDTLQRLVFYLAAILSNKDSVLIFEEPESHAFPYHTKYLAESIALDERGNQYFISTHNPYFLLPLLEKCPKQEVAVFITYWEDYQTKVKLIAETELAEIMEIDIFSNLDRFLHQ